MPTPTPFRKMHGLGNDFAMFDARHTKLTLSADQVRQLADRHFGIGCDQLIVLETAPAVSENPSLFMRIYNPDGSEAQSCGNATRCAGWLLMQESGQDQAVVHTLGGVLQCRRTDELQVEVDMGEPQLGWQEIGLAKACDMLALPVALGELSAPAAVGMGNPHMVFWVPDAAAAPLAELGRELEHHPLFPQRVNVSAVSREADGVLCLRVWERGAGLTLACGTAACAALVAAVRWGKAARKERLRLPGGELEIEWREADGHVRMRGPVAESFTGSVAL
jgi:diaminopimelate epimerase